MKNNKDGIKSIGDMIEMVSDVDVRGGVALITQAVYCHWFLAEVTL